MKSTRSSVPPAPVKEKIPGPIKAGTRRKYIGKKPDSDRNELSLVELRARRPLPGSFADTYPEATDEDGKCDYWGDNNRRLTREEKGVDANPDYPHLSPRAPENMES